MELIQKRGNNMGKKTIFEDDTDTFKPIEPDDEKKELGRIVTITKEGKKKPKEIEFVFDEERAAILDDPVRLLILKILREGIEDFQTTEEYNEETSERIIRKREVRRNIMSVLEIVKMSEKLAKEKSDSDLKLSKNQIYHHLPILEDPGKFVVKYATVKRGERTTDYYRRSADGFVLTGNLSEMDHKTIEKKSADWIERTTKVFAIDLTEEQKEELIQLQISALRSEFENRNRIAKLIRGDVAEDMVLSIYEWLIHTYTIGDPEYVKTQKRIREILFGEE